MFVANHEENIKTKNIVEKIKFEGENFYFWNNAQNGSKNNFGKFLDVSTVLTASIKPQVI